MGKALDDLNAKVDLLTTTVETLSGGVDNIATEIQKLIDGGNGATQAQLEAIGTKIDAIQTKAQADSDKLTAMDPTP